MLCLSACSNEKGAVEYAKELSSEVVSCTTMEEFDVVYEKITAIKADPRFMAQPGETNEEKKEIVQATAKLIFEALAVKAILVETPDSINITPTDMKTLTEQCISMKLNTTVMPYTEVGKLVRSHFGIDK